MHIVSDNFSSASIISTELVDRYREALDNSYVIREKLDTFGQILSSIRIYSSSVKIPSNTHKIKRIGLTRRNSMSKQLSASSGDLNVEKQRVITRLTTKDKWAQLPTPKSVIYSADVQRCRMKAHQKTNYSTTSLSHIKSGTSRKGVGSPFHKRLRGLPQNSHPNKEYRSMNDIREQETLRNVSQVSRYHSHIPQPSTSQPLSRWVLVERNIQRKVEQIRAYPKNKRYFGLNSTCDAGYSPQEVLYESLVTKWNSDQGAATLHIPRQMEQFSSLPKESVCNESLDFADAKEIESGLCGNESGFISTEKCDKSARLRVSKFFRRSRLSNTKQFEDKNVSEDLFSIITNKKSNVPESVTSKRSCQEIGVENLRFGNLSNEVCFPLKNLRYSTPKKKALLSEDVSKKTPASVDFSVFYNTESVGTSEDVNLIQLIRLDVDRSLKTLEELENNIDRASKFFDASVTSLLVPTENQFIVDDSQDFKNHKPFSAYPGSLRMASGDAMPASRQSLPLHCDEAPLRTLAIENRLKAYLAFGDKLEEWEKQFQDVKKVLGEEPFEEDVEQIHTEQTEKIFDELQSSLDTANSSNISDFVNNAMDSSLRQITNNQSRSFISNQPDNDENQEEEFGFEAVDKIREDSAHLLKLSKKAPVKDSSEILENESFLNKENIISTTSGLVTNEDREFSTSRAYDNEDKKKSKKSRNQAFKEGEVFTCDKKIVKKKAILKKNELADATLIALRDFYEASVKLYTIQKRELRKSGKIEEADELSNEELAIFKRCAYLKRKYKDSVKQPFSMDEFIRFHVKETAILHQMTLDQVRKLKRAGRKAAISSTFPYTDLTQSASHQQLRDLVRILRRRDSVSEKQSESNEPTESELSSVSNISFTSNSCGPVKLFKKQTKDTMEERESLKFSSFSPHEKRMKLLRKELAEKRKEAEKLREDIDRELRESSLNKEKEESLLAQIAAHEKYIDRTRKDLSQLCSLEATTTSIPGASVSKTSKSARPSLIPKLTDRLTTSSVQSKSSSVGSAGTSQRTLADISSLCSYFPEANPLASPGGRSDISETSTLKGGDACSTLNRFSTSLGSDTSTIKEFVKESESNITDEESLFSKGEQLGAPNGLATVCMQTVAKPDKDGEGNDTDKDGEGNDKIETTSSVTVVPKFLPSAEETTNNVEKQETNDEPEEKNCFKDQEMNDERHSGTDQSKVDSVSVVYQENSPFTAAAFEEKDLETAHTLLSLYDNSSLIVDTSQAFEKIDKLSFPGELLLREAGVLNLPDAEISRTNESTKPGSDSMILNEHNVPNCVEEVRELSGSANNVSFERHDSDLIASCDLDEKSLQRGPPLLRQESNTPDLPFSTPSIADNASSREPLLRLEECETIEVGTNDSGGTTAETLDPSYPANISQTPGKKLGAPEFKENELPTTEDTVTNKTPVSGRSEVEKRNKIALNASPLALNSSATMSRSPLPPRSPSPVSTRFITIIPTLTSPRSPKSPARRVSKIPGNLSDEMMAKMMDDSLNHMLPILQARKQNQLSGDGDMSSTQIDNIQLFSENNSFFGNESFDLNKISAPADILNVPSLDLSEVSFCEKDLDLKKLAPESLDEKKSESVAEFLHQNENSIPFLESSITSMSEDYALDQEALTSLVLHFSQQIWAQAEAGIDFNIQIESSSEEAQNCTVYKQLIADRCCEIAKKVFEKRSSGPYIRVNRIAPFRPKNADQLNVIMQREIVSRVFPGDGRREKKRWEIVGRNATSVEELLVLEELYNDQDRWRDLEQDEKEIVEEISKEIINFQLHKALESAPLSGRISL